METPEPEDSLQSTSEAENIHSTTFIPGAQLQSVLYVLTLIGTVEDDRLRKDVKRLTAARYLVALIVLQSASLVVGKVAFFEVIWMAREIGYTVVFTTLSLGALEATLQFIGAASVPRLYFMYHGTPKISLKGLTVFSINAYFVSNSFALVFYATIASLALVIGPNIHIFVAFVVVQAIQYPLLGQLGDQAVEMELPHMLDTFKDLMLVAPALGRGSCCCCCKVLARANADSLAYFLSLAKFVCGALFAFVYIVADKAGGVALRWAMLIAFSSLTLYSSFVMSKGFPIISRGLCDQVVIPTNHVSTPWIWAMPAAETLLAVFAALVFTVPADAVIASFAVLYLRVSAVFVGAISFIIALVVIGFLSVKVSITGKEKISTASTSSMEDSVEENLAPQASTRHEDDEITEMKTLENEPQTVSFREVETTEIPRPPSSSPTFYSWLWLYFFTLLDLAVVALLFWTNSSIIRSSSFAGRFNVLLLLGALFLIPYFALHNDLLARFSSWLFEYSEGHASAIIYYRNLFTVVFKAPLLILSYYALMAMGGGAVMASEENDTHSQDWEESYEERRGSLALGVSCAILAVGLLYYAVCDRFMGKASVERLVDWPAGESEPPVNRDIIG